MRSLIRKSLILASGAVAAIAVALPSSTYAATTTAVSPNLTASDCASGPAPHDFQLEVAGTSYAGELDSSSDLYFGGGTPQDFCQALVSTGTVEIFTSSTNYCLIVAPI